MFKFLNGKKNDPGKELRSLIGDFELPSFNAIVMDILQMLRDPDSSMKEIAGCVQIDPGTNVKVLRTVNSAAFGLASKVSNVLHAVSLLGRSRLELIVLAVAVRDSLPEMKSLFLDGTRFWTISSKRAMLARELAELLHPSTKAESYTAALLQDMAIPVILCAKKEKYDRVLEKWYRDEESTLDRIEKDAFGYDHSAVGALMAMEWDLPQHLVDSIAGHHNDDQESKAEPAVRLVSYLRYDDEGGLYTLKENCVSAYNLNEESLDHIIEKAFNKAEDLAL